MLRGLLMANFQEKASFIWSIADSVLRGPYKRNEYQDVILPFVVLKRFDSVLEYSKQDVLETYEKYKDELKVIAPVLLSKAKDEDGNSLDFYNFSKFDLKSLLEDPDNIEENLIYYIDCFSNNVKGIFDNFEIKKQIEKLAKANVLYLLIRKFNETQVDLSPKAVSNHEMGTIFEELIRRFSEQSNEEAGEHFTPRDVVKLMTELMFAGSDDLEKKGLIKKVYDPACGTGGMLTSCKEYVSNINKDIDVVLYGQEINPQIYAICKADMLMKGEQAGNIKGPSSTLSDDRLKDDKFDYMISNPPYGRDWEMDKEAVEKEAERGYSGRFGAGTPRKSDGQLLFIQHMLSKMKHDEKSRIAVITNGSPLFTGDAGSGESEIRRWIIENDYLEALIGLPDSLFFNTGIKTYIWILTNQKASERKGKIQLVDATEEFVNMRKSLGNKRHQISDENFENIISAYKEFKEIDKVKIFDNDDFGYTKITVERPKQDNYHVTEERLQNLYSYNQFKNLAVSKSKDPITKQEEEEKGRIEQERILNALRTIDDTLYKNRNDFEKVVNDAVEDLELKPNFIKNIIDKLAEHDETAEYFTDKKGNKKADSDLRDYEKIPLKKNIDEYFEEEVSKYYPDAWIDEKSLDKIGYEINFTRYFYVYEPPRDLADIEEDIRSLRNEIKDLFEEVF